VGTAAEAKYWDPNLAHRQACSRAGLWSRTSGANDFTMPVLERLLRAQGVAIIDGGLGSLLGPEITPGLWSAGYLLDETGCSKVQQAHLQFLDRWVETSFAD
jgi:hypothetical protein